MDAGKLLVFCLMLLIVAVFSATSGNASEEGQNKKIASNKDITSSECASHQRIPCNWEGWRNSYPEVRCRSKGCFRYSQAFKMKCLDGYLSEVRAYRICMDCAEP